MQNWFPTKDSKSEVMRLFLCEARRQNRSIVSLCEEFGDRRAVQNLPIGTILMTKSNKFTNKIKKKKVWEEHLSIAKRER